MKSHRTPVSFCLRCGHTLDAATCISRAGAKPRAFDVTVCVGCGAILQFDATMRLQPISEQQAVAGLNWQAIAKLRLLRREIDKRGPMPNKETKQ